MKRVVASLTARLLALVPPRHQALVIQFSRFGVVGLLGFCWATGTIYATAPFVGPYWAAFFAYVLAASANWLINRLWTFADRVHAPMHRQWVTFLLANSLGSVLYLGTYSFLVAKFAFFHHYLVLASVAGTCASMFVNFNASRHLVFK